MKLVAITSCSTGIAHTYMAAEKLMMEAKVMGHEIKVGPLVRKIYLQRKTLPQRTQYLLQPIPVSIRNGFMENVCMRPM